MTWSDLALPSYRAAQKAAVAVACNQAGFRRQFLKIMLRPSLIEGRLPWFEPGGRVMAQLGADKNVGRLRIVPDPHGAYVTCKNSGKAPYPALKLIGFPGLPSAAQPLQSVPFGYGDDWLELTLPDWVQRPVGSPLPVATWPTRSPVASAAPVATSPTLRPAKTGFSMAGMTAPQAMRK